MGDYEKDQALVLALWEEGEAETDESINSENDSDEVYVEDSDQSSIKYSDYEPVHVSDDEFIGKDGVTKWCKNCGTKSTRSEYYKFAGSKTTVQGPQNSK
ncbi:hypothetical protein CBL_10052 [Carabus blaptoides fortunei]